MYVICFVINKKQGSVKIGLTIGIRSIFCTKSYSKKSLVFILNVLISSPKRIYVNCNENAIQIM